MHDSHDEAKIQESLNRFIGYAQSSQINYRNLVGSTALETLPLVASRPKDVATVLELLSTVAVDPEVDVRCNVLEYIVHIALMLSDPNKSCETLRSFITSHVLPIIVTALLDVDPKVVKLADCSLIVLLEHCLVPNGYVQERIWPAIVKKMYDQPLIQSIIRVITLMSKMVPWVGCDTTETLFVPLFVQLCSYPDVVPRKACASIIGDFCAVVSLRTVENKLVPSFLALCSDTVWVVRKACAEVFTSVSSAASTYTRKHHLTPAFAALLTDPLSYVCSAAFQSLGPFITTFAEPSITNLGYNHQGKLVLRHPDGFEFQLNANIELNMTERMILSEPPHGNNYFWTGEFEDEEDEEDEVKTELLETEDKKNSTSTLDNKELTENELSNDNKENNFDNEKSDKEINSEKQDDEENLLKCDQSESDMNNLQKGDTKCESLESNNDGVENTCLENSNVKDNSSDQSISSENQEGSKENMNNDVTNTFQPQPDPVEEVESEEEKKDKDKTDESSLEEKDFSEFLFWRDPIPDIEINLKLEAKKAVSSTNTSVPEKKTVNQGYVSVSDRLLEMIQKHEMVKFKKTDDTQSSKSDKPGKSIPKMSAINDPSLIFACLQKFDASKKRFLDGNGNACNDERGETLVPDELINHFVSMSSPRLDKMQNELAHHCAYNLPAVALTLGPENWPLIKQACNALATDQQWRVRKIVASSIHELAVIVGSDVATEDLVPLFTGFIKDLDEVRIGALKHLANFLKLLKPAGRNSFLPRLAEFLVTDYEWNWRFRAELAEQLLQIVRLFTPQDISVHIAPVVFTLLQDKVAYVRNIALQLVVEVVSIISKEGILVRSAVAELAEQFAHSSRWSRRQTFAHLCSELVEEKALPIDMFARDILPHLLDLSWDKVPNVRLSVASTLSRHIMSIDTFSNPSSPHHEVVMVVLKRLQSDKDRDVRFFATLPPHLFTETTQTPAQLPEGSTVDSNKVVDAQEDTLR